MKYHRAINATAPIINNAATAIASFRISFPLQSKPILGLSCFSPLLSAFACHVNQALGASHTAEPGLSKYSLEEIDTNERHRLGLCACPFEGFDGFLALWYKGTQG
jgi:hypothetical protein